MIYDPEDFPQPEPTKVGSMTISPVIVEYGTREMFDAIVRCAAGQLVESIGGQLSEDIRRATKERINDAVGQRVSEMLDGSIQPTNEWGEAKGAAMTLRDMVVGKAGSYLGAKVDKDGRESNYSVTGTRLEFLVGKQVEEVFSHQLKTEVKKAVELAVVEAKQRVGKVVGDMLIKLT
jgi:hypothetical protein